ncbi:hypothetical protein ACV229_15485 [Burkholderia sp. MR1-5-21]
MEHILREKSPPATVALPPPPADPRNFEGTWLADVWMPLRVTKDMYGSKVPLTDKAKRILERRAKATYVENQPYLNAAAACRPAGQHWQLGMIYPFTIFQTRNSMTWIFSEMHTVWGIQMGKPRKEANGTADKAYMGTSTAHWDGNTLVVETDDYRQPLWLDADGTPSSTKVHVTHRIRRIDYGGPKLEVVTTTTDPEMFTHPWTISRTYAWRPDFAQFQEYNCEKKAGGDSNMTLYGYRKEEADLK